MVCRTELRRSPLEGEVGRDRSHRRRGYERQPFHQIDQEQLWIGNDQVHRSLPVDSEEYRRREATRFGSTWVSRVPFLSPPRPSSLAPPFPRTDLSIWLFVYCLQSQTRLHSRGRRVPPQVHRSGPRRTGERDDQGRESVDEEEGGEDISVPLLRRKSPFAFSRSFPFES